MKHYDTPHIRNVALVSHSGTGKTTLAESMLWITGATKRFGKVDDGNSTLDYLEDEIERKMTLALKLCAVEAGGCKVNLVDTPGYADFAGDQMAGLRVADAVLMSLRADAGVEAATEIVWDRVQGSKLPVVLAISQMGREGNDFDKAIASAREGLTDRVFPLFLPIGTGDGFRGVVNVVDGQAYEYATDGKGSFKAIDCPADLADTVAEARANVVDAAAEGDDELVEKYLEEGDLGDEDVLAGMKKAMRAGVLVPAVPCDAMSGVGVSHLLDVLTKLAPSPVEVGPATGDAGGNEVEVAPDKDGKASAIIFKTLGEGHVGDLYFFRVYSGTLKNGLDLRNTTRGSQERLGQPSYTLGKERMEAEAVVAGDMAGAVKLKDTRTGDTLSDKDLGVTLPPIAFPNPTLSEAIVCTGKGDEEKMGQGLHRLAEEDPTLHVVNDAALHQTLLQGVGDLQLDLATKRLKRRFGVDVELIKPRIPYRETIRGKKEVQGRYKKQTGGRGQFGDVHLRVEAMARGEGFEFLNEITGGVVPTKFIPAVEKGVRETMTHGVLAGYPVVDVRAALFFGSYHAVDSSENAFKMAATMAFKEAFEHANPVILEPIMEVTVTVPEEFMGDVMGDVSSKRGKILGMDSAGARKLLKALLPQGEMYRYATHLRSLTQGRAWHKEEFSHYEEVPPDQQQKIIAEAKEEKEHANA